MNIVLLNPPYSYKVVREGRCQHETAIWDSVYPPLSLATIASFLRDHHRVKIIDAIAASMDVQALDRALKEFPPHLIISSVSTPTIREDLRVLKHLRERTGARIAIFGVHATYFADELIREDYLDFVLLNDPEFPAVAIASGSLSNLEGVVYKDNGRPVRVPSNLKRRTSFRIPAWDLVDLKKYKIPIKRKSYVLMSTARGCPFDCSFCVVPYYNGKKVRYREIPEVIEELKAVAAYVDEVFFYTDLFTFKKEYVLELCDRMVREKLDLHWSCNSRVDTFDRDMAVAMKKAGCWMVSFGIESGNQKILDLCGKKITLPQSKNAVATARKAGLISIGHFVLGFPGETAETVRQTMRFSRDINPDFVEFYIATPFPGSRLFDEIKNDLVVDWTDIRYDFDPYHYPFDLVKLRKRAYFQFYLRPAKIWSFIRLFGVHRIAAMSVSAARFLQSFLIKK